MRVYPLILILILCFQSSVGAAVNYTLEYEPENDRYHLSYDTTGVSSMWVKYDNRRPGTDNVGYHIQYTGSEITGDYYFTCNGGYIVDWADSDSYLLDIEPFDITNLTQTCGDTGGSEDPGTEPNPTTCGECEKLAEMLACPEWDTYMGELTDAVSAALPPPPNWDEVAETMRDHIVPPLIDGMVNEVVPAMGAEMDRVLGHPAPPPSVSTPQAPQMNGTEGVTRPVPTDSTPPAQTFNLDSTPSVEIQPDTTGGIDLGGVDIIDLIPHSDDNYMPMPGKETGGFTPTQKTTINPIPTNEGAPPPAVFSKPTDNNTTTVAPSATNPGVTNSPPLTPRMPMPNQ